MKKLLLSAIAACSLAAAHAQQNSVLLYGNVAGSYSSSEIGSSSASTNSFAINLGAGYQFSDHFTVGITGRYFAMSRSNNTPGGPENTSNGQYAAGPFGRYTYYFTDRIFTYLQGDILYTHHINGENGLSANLFPAVGVFIHKHWAINLNIGGIDFSHARAGQANNNNLSYSFGQGLAIGVSKNFVRKQKAAPTVQ